MATSCQTAGLQNPSTANVEIEERNQVQGYTHLCTLTFHWRFYTNTEPPCVLFGFRRMVLEEEGNMRMNAANGLHTTRSSFDGLETVLREQ